MTDEDRRKTRPGHLKSMVGGGGVGDASGCAKIDIDDPPFGDRPRAKAVLQGVVKDDKPKPHGDPPDRSRSGSRD